ncbi:short-chain dehydrogenase [Meridianimarinicoccus roseus]|uniref:Short-chain dehydrogenase n=1 Tax=Meridianimarinicoccus roseus TaxID=2072018 RepID=A0A2V2LMW7_9RHOB|nr:SDR family oxidoreductase [Meridianimarinicoccus roseus]PWR04546.1 short-chain dehydrogenase [Meridianimarinicoccus roseus]
MTESRPGLDLSGKTVIVTGGAGILGRNFCRGFADVGATVAVLDRDADMTGAAAEEIGGTSFGIACDITSPESVREAMESVTGRTGRLDVLVNNAASKSRDVRAFFTPFEDYDLDIWRDVMAVNVDGMFLMSQAAGRQFLAQGGGGSVINIASIYGLVGPDPRIYEGSDYLGGPINTPAVYSASKAAVVGLTKWLATHWGPRGIRANCLVPGGVASGQNGVFQQNYASRTPMERMAEAREIVGPAVFLASDEASYITGQVLAADGGWTAW